MKKILTLFVAMLTLLSLFACGDAESSSTATSSGDMVTSSTSAVNNDCLDEIENQKDAIIVNTSEETVECYSMLACGEYLGDEFDNMYELVNCYSIIKGYDELCEKTELGYEYSKDIFNDFYVVVIKRIYNYNYYTNDIIGYRNFRVSLGAVTIDRCCWEADYTEYEYIEWNEIVYLCVPKADIDEYDIDKNDDELKELKEEIIPDEYPDIYDSIPTTGTIVIKRDKVSIYDTAYCEVKENIGYENGTAWVLEPSELKGFLEKYNLSIKWNRTCDCECGFYYCSTKYKILVVYREDAGVESKLNDKPIGYRDATIYDGCLYITRESKAYMENARNVKAFEFVAIPSEHLSGLENGVSSVNISSIINYTALVERNEITLSNMVGVKDESNIYYVFLDLGSYYRYDELPSGNAYHIITDYSELLDSVEKPFITKKEFGDNYIVVMKIEQYAELKNSYTVYGIKNLSFEENLFATLDIGNSSGETATEEELSDIVYILVPRTELACDGKTIGELNLKINDDESSLETYFIRKDVYHAFDQAWFVYNSTSKNAIEKITKLDLDQYVQDFKQGQLLLVYYGKLSENTVFKDFYIEGENMYMDIVLDPNRPRIKGYHIIKIDNCYIDYESEKSYKLNVTKYEREVATLRTEEEINILLETFCVSDHTEYYRLTMIPEFDWTVAETKDELKTLMKRHTNTSVESIFPDVDFENYCVLVDYVVESCTRCHYNASFRKPQYDDGSLTINKCVPIHDCNETVVPCIYFIVIPREFLDGEIIEVVIVDSEA